MVLVNSGFPQAKEFLRRLLKIWASALQNVRQPCYRSRKFKQCKFARGAKLMACQGRSHVSSWPCIEVIVC